jgi:CBS domain-containing protein
MTTIELIDRRPDRSSSLGAPPETRQRNVRSQSDLYLLARDLMTSPAVVAAGETSVREVARLMLDQGVGAVPVLDASGVAIAMVSDGDLLGRRPDDGRRDWWLGMLASGAASDDINGLGDRAVRDVMSAPLISIAPGAPVQDVAEALQAHRVKRLPVIEDGRALGVVSRADLLCVVESIPRPRIEEEAGARILGFLESLIGGASLSGTLERPAAAAIEAPPPPPPSVISAAAFRASVRAFKQESVDRQRQARREAELNRRQQIKAFLDHHVSAQFWRELLDRAELAARAGEQELMLLRLPSDLCSDGGRKIDVAERGWEETLRGEAAEIYDRWRKELKPQGFGFSARIVSYDDGIVGDVGLYLTWGE